MLLRLHLISQPTLSKIHQRLRGRSFRLDSEERQDQAWGTRPFSQAPNRRETPKMSLSSYRLRRWGTSLQARRCINMTVDMYVAWHYIRLHLAVWWQNPSSVMGKRPLHIPIVDYAQATLTSTPPRSTARPGQPSDVEIISLESGIPYRSRNITGQGYAL